MGHPHEHGPAQAPSALELALSIRPLVAEAPRLIRPPATAREIGDGPVLADALGASGEVFRPPRTG